jgi:DNA-directed RNA polymerase subunit M/transcription elongation factor TFIIS
MSKIVRKQQCRCVNCGNEAEMVLTCSLPENVAPPAASKTQETSEKAAARKVKATGTCSHCGNEADMWIDL